MKGMNMDILKAKEIIREYERVQETIKIVSGKASNYRLEPGTRMTGFDVIGDGKCIFSLWEEDVVAFLAYLKEKEVRLEQKLKSL